MHLTKKRSSENEIILFLLPIPLISVIMYSLKINIHRTVLKNVYTEHFDIKLNF